MFAALMRQTPAAVVVHVGAKPREDLGHQADVFDFRDVVEGDLVARQQAGREGVISGVLAAADAHGALQGLASLDE